MNLIILISLFELFQGPSEVSQSIVLARVYYQHPDSQDFGGTRE